MKRSFLAISLLLHLLAMVLLLRVPMTVQVHRLSVNKPIEVVPMSPPLKMPRLAPPPPAAPPQAAKPKADVPIIVRPFTLPATPGRPGGGTPQGDTRGSGSNVPPAPQPQKTPPVPAPPAKEEKKPPPPGRLVINLREIEKKLQEEKNAAANTPFNSAVDLARIPFGEGHGEGDGGSPVTAYGGSAFFDAHGYDITPWAQRAVYRVKANWLFPPAVSAGIKGVVGVYLVIERDGRISSMEIRQTSGIQPFDQAALNALKLSVPFAELPFDFPRRNLPAYFIFHYN